MKRIKIKPLSFGLKAHGGRNLSGAITAPRRKALVKRSYRYLDTKRHIPLHQGATIIRPYLYDPNRTGYISLIMFPNGVITYILAGAYSQDQKKISNLTNLSPYNENSGSAQLLQNIKNGTQIFNCELYHTKGGQLLDSAGVSGIILKKLSQSAFRTIIKLKSGALHSLPLNATANIGQTSNENHFLIKKKKAGQNRLKGRRPRSRPSAMNPVITLWVAALKVEYTRRTEMGS